MRSPYPLPSLTPSRRLSIYLKFTVGLAFVLTMLWRLPIYVDAQKGEAAPPFQKRKGEFVPGELLVRFRAGSAPSRAKSRTLIHVRAMGSDVPVEFEPFGGTQLVPGLMLARIASADPRPAVAGLLARDDVLYAEPNYIRRLNAVPNDTRYADLYALKNSAAGGAGISAESAWDTTTGNHNVVVGVIDSGIDTGHLDLKDNIFVNTGEVSGNGIDDDGNGFTDDVNGWDFLNNDSTVFDNAGDDAHGTHVGGTIGARGNNGAGVSGVNWNVQIMPLKALGSQGGSDADLLDAYNYAKMMRQRGVNLRVLNNSYGGQGFSQSLRDAIDQLNLVGILFVAAAGNATTISDYVPEYPASYELPNVISVAASDSFGNFASSFSNRGPQSIHLAAPGDNILSTTPRGYAGTGLVGAYTESDGSTYSRFNGTSMASAHVAGAAALACAAQPNLSLPYLRAAVLYSGDESGSFFSYTITGRRLNAHKTVQAALENDVTAPGAPANFRINAQNGRQVELRWNESGDDGTTGRASLDEIIFTDSVTNEQFLLNSSRTLVAATERSVFVYLPFIHPNGQLTVRTLDNAGNFGSASINVTVSPDVSDPYLVTLEAPGALTAQNSGTPIGLKGDDKTLDFYTIPFPFPFFGTTVTSVAVSTNGVLYVPVPGNNSSTHPNVGADDFAIATRANLEHLSMIAGMWSDLRTDRRASDDVYVVKPDRDRIIFRWQAVTFGAETPVNFEIELRRDGTIQSRYGDGNANLQPVLTGISGGDPATYPVSTHSSESAPLSLTNAQAVTFSLRNPPPPPSSDLAVTITASPNPVVSGQQMSFNVSIKNLGPSVAEDLVMTDTLPAGTTFVSCTSSHVFATCTGPAVGSNGTITGRIATLDVAPHASPIGFTIVAHVTAAPGTTLQNTASATSFRPDPNPSNNSATSSSPVVEQTFLNGMKAIAAGRWHSTSLANNGTVWNWGTGSNGQLGDGSSGNGVAIATPIQVARINDVTAVADGNGFVLALKSDGTVWGWGSNGVGQLGDGTQTDRSIPVQTAGLSGVTAIAAGTFYSAALKSDGTVWIWGQNVGLGAATPNVRIVPTQLTGISNVSAISGGGGHLLMLKSDQTVWAAGANSRGELGDGTTTNRPFPVRVLNLSNIVNIAAGDEEHSAAVRGDGTVWAWGINFHGELGPGGGPNNFDPHPTPLQVTGLPAGMTKVSTGRGFCIALDANGSVWGWGNDSNWQTGRGSGVGNNSVPNQIPNFSGVVALAAGDNHSVALKSDGTVWTWGGNDQGQLGDGTTTQHMPPRQVSTIETVRSPSFSVPAGTYNMELDVTVSCATPGATIRYTLNGNPPTENDPVIASGTTLHLTGFTFLFARAWKSGSITSSMTAATYNIDVAPPLLASDQSGPAADQLAALDSTRLLRDPFPVIDPLSSLADRNTRIILFVTRLQILPTETASSFVVNLTDVAGHTFDVPAEDVRWVPNLGFMQVTFRLPDTLAAGSCVIRLKAHNQTSNLGTIRIKS
ncbi:MAG TPA: S8 family serine peptidase [Pyrinomonadaceae bacterium]